MKKLFLLYFALPMVAVAGEVTVTSVTAQQRYPWDGIVDVSVRIQGSAEDLAVTECSFAATNSATKAEIPVAHITRNGDDSGSGSAWTRKFIWDAKTDVGAVKIDDVAFTVDVKPKGVQLWENGPYWAECNVGATKPEECGYYFWWGDTVGYKREGSSWNAVDGSRTGFSFSSGNCPTYGKDKSQLVSEGYIDATGNLVAAYDAATAHLGAPWRMPTDAEFAALISNCDTEWTSRNGVLGRLVKGRDSYASKSIFLPAAGDGNYSRLYGLGSYGTYWSSTPSPDRSDLAEYLYLDSGYFSGNGSIRYFGPAVRPVRGFTGDYIVASGGVTTHLSVDNRIVTSVTAQQRHPNGLVDITVTIRGSAEDLNAIECAFAATNSATNAEIPVVHVTRNGDDVGSGSVWTRKYIWDAKADVEVVKIDDVAFTVNVKPMGVQLWEDGPFWAECNVGATKPEECGYYFWWGGTVGYMRNASNNGWVSVEDETGFSFSTGNCPTYGKDKPQLLSEDYIDATDNLVAAHDAATAYLGTPWRMPTDAEYSALINKCDTEWTSRNGVSGRLVKGRGAYATKSIFLPAVGYGSGTDLNLLGSGGRCWSSTPYSGDCAWNPYFGSGGFYRNYNYRYLGQSVRPVRGFAGDYVAVSGGVTTHLSVDNRIVTSVTAQQRYPGSGLVDVTVTLQGSADDLPLTECTFAAMNSATKVAIPVEHITRNGEDLGADNIWTRKFTWDVRADIGVVKIEDVVLSVDAFMGVVQLWENGPYWATCNVGATKPEESGYYFWWGDTVGYKRNAIDDGWVSVDDEIPFMFDSEKCPTFDKSNLELQSAGYIDSTGHLVAEHDAATAHLGAPWRMPKDAEFSALISNCDTEWTSLNGVSGRLVKGRGAYSSKSIFLPAAGYGNDSNLGFPGTFGYFWSSTLYSDDCRYAWYLGFYSNNFYRDYLNYRSIGHPVRPVRGFANVSTLNSETMTHLKIDCRSVTGVTAQQRYPWNGLVDVTVMLQGSADDIAATECMFAAMNSSTKEAIPVEHITRNGDDTGSGGIWTRKFIWDAKTDVGAVKIDDVALSVDTFFGVQLWENGPYWATCNVGAKKPEEYGYYFWWGDTVGYRRNVSNTGWASVKDSASFSFSSENCPTYGKSNSQLQSMGFIDTTGNLVATHDAATAHLGASWRMPTDAEFSAMINNCDTEWTSLNGVSGRLVKGRGAYSPKSIFLPAAGYGGSSGHHGIGLNGGYRTSTPSSRDSGYVCYLYFALDYFYRGDYDDRVCGRSVRPVRGFANASAVNSDVMTHLYLDCMCAKVVDSTHPLVYDTAWYEGGMSARITANGRELVSGTSGTYAWAPSTEGVSLLTLNVYNDSNEVVGTENVFCLSREGLADLRIPEGTTEIGEYTFADGQFTSVIIPNSVTNVAQTAFAGCSNVISVGVNGGLCCRFPLCEVFSEEWMAIGDGQYRSKTIGHNESTEMNARVRLPNARVCSFGWKVSSESGCDKLEYYVDGAKQADISGSKGWIIREIPLPAGEHEIRWRYFKDGSANRDEDCGWVDLSELMALSATGGISTIFPDSYGAIQTIACLEGTSTVNSGMFEGCSGLEEVTFPTGVMNVGEEAFKGCESLRRVNVPSMADWVGMRFGNVEANPLHTGAVLYVGGVEVTGLEIPDGTTEIGEYAFAGGQFASVTIPKSVTNVAPRAFAGCSNIVEVSLGSGLFGEAKREVRVCDEPEGDWSDIGNGQYRSKAIGHNGSTQMSVHLNLKEAQTCSFKWKVSSESGYDKIEYSVDGTRMTDISGSRDWETKEHLLDAGEHTIVWRYYKDYTGTSGEDCGWVDISELLALNVSGAPTLAMLFPDSYMSICSVRLDDGFKKIGRGMFAGCASLEAFAFPPEVTWIGTDAFAGCDAIKRVDVGSIDQFVMLEFENENANPLHTGAALYVGEEEVTVLVIPEGTTEIGEYAFAGGQFTSVTIPNSVTNVAPTAFAGCENIASIAVSSCVNVATVFSDSKDKIAHVAISAQGDVPASAYAGCSALERVDVASMTDWMSLRFADAEANPLHTGAALYVDGKEVTELVIPEGTMEIGEYAFMCGHFTSVTIPNGVTNVAPTAFAGCKNIKTAIIGGNFLCTSSGNVADGAWGARAIDPSLWVPTSGNVIHGVEPEFDGRRHSEGRLTDLDPLSRLTNGSVEMAGQYFSDTIGIAEGVITWELPTPSDLTKLRINTHWPDGGRSGANIESVEIKSAEDGTWRVLENSKFSYGVTYDGRDDGTGADLEFVFENGEKTVFAKDVSAIRFNLGAQDNYGTGFTEFEVVADTGKCDLSVSSVFPDSFEQLESLEITSGLVSVEQGLLKGCESLRRLVLPQSVRRIDAGAFVDCVALESVVFPSELEDFGLDVIPEAQRQAMGLRYDADGFMIWNGWLLDYENREASEVTMPEGVIGIGRGALADLYDLETVRLPSTLKYIALGAFARDSYLDEVEIPDSVVRIGDGAFEDCSWMQTISVGRGVERVGSRAFAGCTKLARIRFEDGLAEIGDCAFSNCWRMMSVSLPLSVTNVATTAFEDCSSLTGVNVPTGIAPLSKWFAPVYRQIKDVTIPSGEALMCSNMFKGCSALARVDIPEGVTNIGDGAFMDCVNLPSVELPSSLQSVGESAFRNCDALTAIGLPDAVSSVGAYAFYDCSRLKDVSLSKNLESLPDHVFDACPQLDSIYVPASVTQLGSRIFSGAMSAVYFIGNAPAYDAEVYASTDSGLVTCVKYGTKGWDGRPTSRDLPQRWPTDNSYGRAIKTWDPVQFDVTFDAGEGMFHPVEAQTYACEQIMYTAYSLPPFNPVRKGYKFAGWWTETIGGAEVTPSTGVKSDRPHTLYAHWDESFIVTVRFNACGGTVLPNEIEYTAEVPFGTLPVPTREHYIFTGWYTAASGGSIVRVSSEVPKADRELFAHWSPTHYEIRFNANNGTGATATQGFIYGQDVTLRANGFSCSGCEFVGWSLTPGGEAVYADGKTISGLAAIEDGVIDLYAVWTGNVYAVRFDSHGGLGVMPNQTFVLGVSQKLSHCTFTRSGYVFKGWALSTTAEVSYGDGGEVCNLTASKNATVVLFAVWERDPQGDWTVEEYLNCMNLTFTLGGDTPLWYGEKVTRADKVGMMRSGAIGDSQTNWIETVVTGAGQIGFWWKANGEYEVSKKGVVTRYDYAEFTIDGVSVEEIGDESDWTYVMIPVEGTGSHILRWMYHKDESGSDGDDCAWLSEVSWEPTQVAEPIPELPEYPTAEDVQSALAGSADSQLLVHVTDAATYNAYREWALKIGATEVKASPFAWASFATDSAALLAKMPTDDDLKVEEFKPSAAAGSFDFTVSVKDVTIGDKASEDNLKKLFGLEGAESLDSAAFSSENVSLDFKEPQDGKLKFSATPAVDNAKSFFMKAKVK